MSIEHIHETSQHREYEYRHHPCHLYHRVSILCYEIHYNYYAEQLESTRYIDISVLKKNNPQYHDRQLDDHKKARYYHSA